MESALTKKKSSAIKIPRFSLLKNLHLCSLKDKIKFKAKSPVPMLIRAREDMKPNKTRRISSNVLLV
jgi:hypothetical protein